MELTGIARGMVVCDAMVKRAGVQVLKSHPIDPGKYLIVFAGPVAEVEEAMDAAEEAGGDTILDRLLLPNAHESLLPAVAGRTKRPQVESLGIVETHTLAGAVLGLDAALKAAYVWPMELRLGAGLGGKGYFVLTGELHDVEAALEAAVDVAGADAMIEIIARPHPDFVNGAL
ncbi:MAG: microcompartment protein CcmL/EutN [Myxococcota bacterium]|jgi:microcompartment protein CcmL/EutN